MLGGMMSAFWLAAPFVLVASYALDRVGIRALVIGGAAIEAIGLVWMTFLSHPVEFFLIRFLMGAGKCLVVTPLPIAVARWFRARTGFGFAVALCGWHVGGLVMAPLSARLIGDFGWRTAAWVLAGLLVGGMALAASLMRDPQLETCAPVSPNADAGPSAADSSEGVCERWASPAALAIIGIGTIAFYAGYAALLSQLSPLLADMGLVPQAIGYATGSVAICAVAGVLLCGALTQFVAPRYSGAAILFLMAALEVGATTLSASAGIAALAALVLLLGLLIGGGDPILIEALRRSVPLKHFGRAYGWWYLVCLAALAVTPVLAGAAFDRNANYRMAFYLLGTASLISGGLWVFALRGGLRGATNARFLPRVHPIRRGT